MAELRNKDELLKVLDQCCDTAYNTGSVTVSRDDIIELHFFVTCILKERDELREVVDGFMDFVPACTYCDGKTSDGERTEKCLYVVDYDTARVYCGKKAIELYATLRDELKAAQDEIVDISRRSDVALSLMARKEECIAAEAIRMVFDKLEERLAVQSFKTKSEDYTDGQIDCMEWVDSRIDELKKELCGDSDA